MTAILGAGLSGLIAATQFQGAYVYERGSRKATTHKAVLRFRSDAISRLTGIPFRKVTVRKSVYSEGEHVSPSIRLANLYSLKTHGGYFDRSIWNLDTVERYIAPENFQHQLLDVLDGRVYFDHEIDAEGLEDLLCEGPVVSTIPMPVMLKMLGLQGDLLGFDHASIVVDRYRVDNADVFQTIYYPDCSTGTYRATMTGDMLIVERRGNLNDMSLPEIASSFGIDEDDISILEESHQQKFGKINPIPDARRKHLIHHLTISKDIYSLGRFAIWKNILLDDLVDDIACIKRFINQGNYAAALHNAKDHS